MGKGKRTKGNKGLTVGTNVMLLNKQGNTAPVVVKDNGAKAPDVKGVFTKLRGLPWGKVAKVAVVVAGAVTVAVKGYKMYTEGQQEVVEDAGLECD